MAEDSFVRQLEMQNRWEPLVKQVKREQLSADSDAEGQLTSNLAVKYEPEEWCRDSDSGIIEECPSEFISSNLLKEEESELGSDSGISEENTAQASTRPGHVQSAHEIFLEQEIVWQFTEDPYSICDPLSTEEEQRDVTFEVAIKEEPERDKGDGSGAVEGQYQDFRPEEGQEPPPAWGPHSLGGPPLHPPPADPPLEGYAAPPLPPAGCWDRRPHLLPKSHYCAVCARWFTSVPHLKRHYGTALHKRCAREKGLPEEPVHKRVRQSWKALLDAGSVSVGSSSDGNSVTPPTPPLPEPHLLPPPGVPRPPAPHPLPSLPSDVGKSSLAQVCPTLPQPLQSTPDTCRASTCGLQLQPLCPYEYERHMQAFEAPLWQQQQHYVYQQHEIRRRMQQDEQHKLYLQNLMQQRWRQFVYPQHPSDSSQLSFAPSAGAPRSDLTVMHGRATVDESAVKTVSLSSPDDTSYGNGRRDTVRIVPTTFDGKEAHGSAVRTLSQSIPATQSGSAEAGRNGSEGVVLQNIEQLKSQYPGITICVAKPRPTHPVLSSVVPLDVVVAPADVAVTPADVAVAPADVAVAPADVAVAPADVAVAPADVAVVKSDASAKSRHICAICCTAFACDSSLRQHVELFHFSDTYFQCEQCGAKLAGLAYYRAHIAEHSVDRPFSCDECSKRFTNRAHLIRHKMLHTGERPFVCHVCSKGFIRKDHMLKHAKVHDCRCAFCVPSILY